MRKEEETRETYNSVAQTWKTKREFSWQPVEEFIDNCEKENSGFIDLGCGSGRHLELAEKKGFAKKNCIGLDYSKGQLEIVNRLGFQTINADLTSIPLQDSKFDYGICIAAHHHLLRKEEQLQSLKEMRRIISKKLLLANWFPKKEYVERELEKGKFKFVENQVAKVTFFDNGTLYDRYYYFFEEEELTSLCKEAGFGIDKKEYHNGNLYLTLS